MKDHDTRIVPAPMANDPRLRSTILDVVRSLNEEVRWHCTMTDHGPFVSGYSIVQRVSKLNKFCASTQDASATSVRKTRLQNRRRRPRI